jgi:hypothetical protein
MIGEKAADLILDDCSNGRDQKTIFLKANLDSGDVANA